MSRGMLEFMILSIFMMGMSCFFCTVKYSCAHVKIRPLTNLLPMSVRMSVHPGEKGLPNGP